MKTEFKYTMRMVETISDYLKANNGSVVTVFECVFGEPGFFEHDPRAVLRLIDKVRNCHMDGMETISDIWKIMHRGCEGHFIRAVAA